MKYAIIHINDRSKENMERTKNILSSFEYISDIEFCDGRKVDARKIIEDMGIFTDWQPYDGRIKPPLPGEFGYWVSKINIYKYIIKNKVEKMLTLDDDAILLDNFVGIFNEIIKELPKNCDFVALYSFHDQNQEDDRTNINLKYLHKSMNQYSSSIGMIYTYTGAKKILRLLKKEGIQYTNDCQIFRKSLEEKLNGYSLIKKYTIMNHDVNVQSTIDPNNYRELFLK